jgi:hypothetical protein
MPDESKSMKPQPSKVGWYYERDGTVVGPVTDARLRYAAKYGHIKPDTLVWREDLEQWIEAAHLPLTAPVWNRQPSSPSIEPTSTAIRPIRIPVEADKPPPEEVTAASQVQSQVTSFEDDTVVEEPLHDAVTDDEAAEPPIDIQMARAIVQRASGRPPELSIPPSSITNRPPPSLRPLSERAKVQLSDFVGSPLRLSIGAACLLMVVAALVILLRPHARTQQATGVTPKAPVVVQHVSTSASSLSVPEAKPVSQPQSAVTGAATPASAANSETSQAPPLAVVPDKLVTVEGPLDVALFLQYLRRSTLIFDEQCWTVYRIPGVKAEDNPTVSVELDVDRTGRVYDTSWGKAPKGYRGVGRCIAGRIRGWKFPPAANGTHAVVTVRRGQ